MAITHLLARHVTVLLLLCCSAGAAVATAQTQDEFFSDDTVQELQLTVSRRDWQLLKDHADLDIYYAADLRWRGLVARNVGIRSRGNTTRNGIKPGLRVDINRYLSQQEFLGLKAFALDNAYSDPSVLRERLTMKMFARLGLPAPREAHVRLFVNGSFAGVYVLIESIDRTFIERVFGAAEAEIEGGGHLFEYRWVRPYYFEDLGPALEAYAELFTPKTHESGSMSSIFAPLREMIRAINQSPDDQFASVVEAHLELSSFMKYLAVENFMAEEDGFAGLWGVHNFYLYRPSHGLPAQLIPWDQDYTFEAADLSIDFGVEANVLARRTMRIPDLRRLYLDSLLDCARVAEETDVGDSRGWLEREVDRQALQIAPSVAEDPFVPFTFHEFENEVSRLLSFARARPGFVRSEVASAIAGNDSRR
jgi:spore coat protein CotH